ncbi:MAG: hypothetical protein JXR88_03215 [Clostridia bacterium]|nr:hypothetical protein [Clostridia bacterium]
MALEIRTQPAILGYHISKPVQSIEQPKAHVEGALTQPQIQVEVRLPKIQIDQTQAFNESGLKNIEAFSQEYVAIAKQRMLESIGRIAEQGDQLAQINKKGNPVPDIAKYNAFDQFKHEFGMVTMPRNGPDISVIEGNVNVRVVEGELSGKIIAEKPRIHYQQGQVERYVAQYNSISIRYLGEKLDLQV